MKYINLTTNEQAEALPSRIVNVDNPTLEQCALVGWREIVEVAEPSEGYRVVRYSPVELTPTTVRMDVAEEVNIAGEQLAAEAARIEAGRALWAVQNRFMELCQQIAGAPSPVKLGFDQLQAEIKTLMATDQQTATELSLKLLTCDAACKREGGLKWWDACVYTEGY